MYISYIGVQNFGVHTIAEIRPQDGFVVVRGGNGAGKSTLCIQAPLYAFFGSSTLEATLQDTVTRGEKETKLSVEVHYGPYVVKRSKSSASVVGKEVGVEISGQAEVSEFFYDLFGIQKHTETLVLVSEQGNTAGILNGKPTAVNNLIEALAGFDQIDDLIERVKDKYPSGQRVSLDDRLEDLNLRLDTLVKVEFPEIEALEIVLNDSQVLKENNEINLKGHDIKRDELRDKMLEDTKHNQALTLAANSLAEKERESKALDTRLHEVYELKDNITVFNAKDIKEANELLANLDDRNKEWAAYQWVQSLTEPDNVWDGTLAEFREELSSTAGRVNSLAEQEGELLTKINIIRAKYSDEKTCPACKQDVSHIHEKINSGLQIEEEGARMSLKLLQERFNGAQDTLAVLNDINNEHLRRVKKARILGCVRWAEDSVPHPYAMISEEAPVKPDQEAVNKASNLISSHRTSLRMLESYIEEEEKLTVSLIKISEAIPKLEWKLEEFGQLRDITQYEKELADMATARNKLVLHIAQHESTIRETSSALAKVKADIENNRLAVVGVKEDIKNTKTLLKTDARNGKILKAVRDAKPKVLELVWAKILFAVSVTFSELVGYDAGVVKDAKGFRINDLPVARLSGSEKSVLGIALRAALRDIFAPTCGFIMFDEPFDSMDIDRTAAATAAIANIRGQRLVISHESDSEMAADSFIEIGG